MRLGSAGKWASVVFSKVPVGSNLPPLRHLQHRVRNSQKCREVRLSKKSHRQGAPRNSDCRKRVVMDALAKVKKKLQDEITALEHEMSVELPKELMKARAHGDLSENAEYKYAKERQGYVSARLGQLKKRLGDIGMLNLNNIPSDRAGYGSRVWVLDVKKSVEIEYKLVTTEEADATQGLISTTSPIGKALLGRHVGDEVKVQTPAGIKEFEVKRLKTIHEDVHLFSRSLAIKFVVKADSMSIHNFGTLGAVGETLALLGIAILWTFRSQAIEWLREFFQIWRGHVSPSE